VEDWNWKTIFYGHYTTIFNHCDVIGQQSNHQRKMLLTLEPPATPSTYNRRTVILTGAADCSVQPRLTYYLCLWLCAGAWIRGTCGRMWKGEAVQCYMQTVALPACCRTKYPTHVSHYISTGLQSTEWPRLLVAAAAASTAKGEATTLWRSVVSLYESTEVVVVISCYLVRITLF